MRREYKYKLQGDGIDSWEIREYDKENNLINCFMVYENPLLEKRIDLSNIDIDTLPEEQLEKLALKLKEKLNL